MAGRTSPTSLPGSPAAGALPEVAGRCYRCGRPTPSPAAGLCDACNPSGIAGPTATQVHGLILASVAGALLVMAVAARLLGGSAGPFDATLLGQAARPDGVVEVVVRITNLGDSAGRPSCAIVRAPDDPGVEFLAERIEPGASMTVTRVVAALPGAPARVVEVRCR